MLCRRTRPRSTTSSARAAGAVPRSTQRERQAQSARRRALLQCDSSLTLSTYRRDAAVPSPTLSAGLLAGLTSDARLQRSRFLRRWPVAARSCSPTSRRTVRSPMAPDSYRSRTRTTPQGSHASSRRYETCRLASGRRLARDADGSSKSGSASGRCWTNITRSTKRHPGHGRWSASALSGAGLETTAGPMPVCSGASAPAEALHAEKA